jgi:hypothetical protein
MREVPGAAVLLFIASLLATGYGIQVDNHALQIPLVHALNDSSLYAGDPFAATLPYYAAPLWRLVALAVRAVPLEALFLALFLLERLLVLFAASRLAAAFFPGSTLAAVGAMALFALGFQPILGSGTIVADYFEQTGLSIPFFLLAAAAFYDSRPTLWAIWLAVGFSLNSMYGAYALTYFGAVFLLDPAYRRAWRTWVRSLGLFLLLASPTLLLTLSAFGREAADDRLWLAVSQVRFQHHLFPLSWGPYVFVKFALLVLVCVVTLRRRWCGAGTRRGPDGRAEEKLFRHVTAWSAVATLWLLCAFVAAYVARSPAMLVTHPARGPDLWHCVAGIALVSACASRVEGEEGRGERALAVAALFASIVIWHPRVGILSVAAVLLALAWAPTWRLVFRSGSPRRLALLLTAWVLLEGVVGLWGRFRQTGSPEAAFVLRPLRAFEEVAEWAAAQTPVDAAFLVDPEWSHFRALSKRPVFVDWKEGAAILWDRTFVGPWTERMRALGLDITQAGLDPGDALRRLEQSYQELDDGAVKRLKDRFALRYWVVPLEHPSALPVAFQNLRYKVLDLE